MVLSYPVLTPFFYIHPQSQSNQLLVRKASLIKMSLFLNAKVINKIMKQECLQNSFFRFTIYELMPVQASDWHLSLLSSPSTDLS